MALTYFLKKLTFFEVLLGILILWQFLHIIILFTGQNFPIPLLCGPLFWLMYSELIEKDRETTLRKFLVLLTPFFCFSTWRLLIAEERIWSYMEFYIPIMLLSQVFYVAYILVNLKRHQLDEETSVLLKQVMMLSLGISIFVALLFLKNYARVDLTLDINPLHTIAMATAFSSFVIFCYLRSFYRRSKKEEEFSLLYTGKRKEEAEGESCVDTALTHMLQLLEAERLYLDPKLTLEKLSSYTGIHKLAISNYLHEELGCGYYEWLASYRIRHAQQILQDSREDYKLEAIAYASGFLSKTTFNRYFKEIVGVPPSIYREQLSLA